MSGGWRAELDGYTRALAGAFIFGIPLVMTMEMWWVGTHLEPLKLAGLLAFGFAAIIGRRDAGGGGRLPQPARTRQRRGGGRRLPPSMRSSSTAHVVGP